MELKVKNFENLVRDSTTNAILNIDEEEYMRYKKQKLDLLKDKKRDQEIECLKNEVKMLKSLIVEIYEKVIKNK